jgi:hypothetical protein
MFVTGKKASRKACENCIVWIASGLVNVSLQTMHTKAHENGSWLNPSDILPVVVR